MEITPVQAASLLGKSERTIQRWIQQKKLPACLLIDGSCRVKVEDIERLMQQSDEMLLARIETLEQEVENLERRIEALEHRSSTTSEPAGKMRRLAGRCQLLKSS